ncbi:hypothetical protein FACS1894133_4640 [Clostridia bacterium]|nr:hypothetical protein FACS1894133_4640 [Clostridia bacterium]
MKTIIVGGGKVGYYLAHTLRESGNRVVVIEKDALRCQYLADSLGETVLHGDGSNILILRAAAIEPEDSLVGITGKDQDNLVICQLAKQLFGIRKTIARVNNPKNVFALKKLGVDIAVSATEHIINLLEREVDNSTVKELLTLGGGKACIMEVTLPPMYAFHQKQLKDIALPASCNIISITRGQDFIIPRGGTKLMSKDVMLIAAPAGSHGDVRKALKLKR